MIARAINTRAINTFRLLIICSSRRAIELFTTKQTSVYKETLAVIKAITIAEYLASSIVKSASALALAR